MFTIILKKNVQKFLRQHRGESIIVQFENSLNIISKSPYQNNLDIKTMKDSENIFRLRIGKYRFLYRISEKNITITFSEAGNRGDIYK